MRTFAPDETIIATHPEGRSNRLGREREPGAPARERHTSRDLALLGLAAVLAIAGSLISFVFHAVDAPEPLIWTWVLIFDLGFKVAAVAAFWILFQRRPRADGLDL